MRDSGEIEKGIYGKETTEAAMMACQAAILEVMLDIRELVGKDLPAILADIKNSIQDRRK